MDEDVPRLKRRLAALELRVSEMDEALADAHAQAAAAHSALMVALAILTENTPAGRSALREGLKMLIGEHLQADPLQPERQRRLGQDAAEALQRIGLCLG